MPSKLSPERKRENLLNDLVKIKKKVGNAQRLYEYEIRHLFHPEDYWSKNEAVR